MSLWMIGLAFLAGVSMIFALNFMLADLGEARRLRARKRLEEEVRLRQKEQARVSLAYKEVYQAAADGLTEVHIRPTLGERFVTLVNESGVAMRPDRLLAVCALVGALVFLPCVLLWQQWGLGTLLGLAAAPLPLVYVAFLRVERRGKLLAQLPSAFELMSRTLRSGQTIAQALHAVADEFSSPISEEFGLCYEQQNLGLSPEAAMRELARRTGLLELRIFVMAVMVQRQTGGNMSELLDKLGRVVRDRGRIRGAIKALTAEGLLQAYVLLALPPGLLAVMWVMNRPYAEVLFEHSWLLVITVASMILGAYWMRRIINFDF
jgi:tight adherence protein B